ncbi:MAG: anti-sigma factor antagonist [Calditrichaeota bacterium]|nr:MAG: anti-sigma factor antagonist [Calditrichota bacterium]
MLKIIDKTVGDVVICKIEGKLSGIEGKGVIQDKVHEFLNKNVNKFVLDLSKVSWIDSTGLGELIASLSSAKKKDGNLLLASIQAPVQSLLQMTNLNQIFEIFDTVEDALAELK